jgi:hypothetical protein
MPFDGSGNYTPAAAPNFPASAGATIVSTYYNAVINDLVTALNNCLTRDGQGKPSAAISWNGQNLTNMGTLSGIAATLTGAFAALSGAFTTITTTGTATIHDLALTVKITPAQGGTGIDGSAAANGKLLIGNGAGYALANLTAGAGITITNGAGTITIAATGGGGSGTTSFPITFNNGGAGAASGTTFDGSAAKTISYNSLGAKPNTPQVTSSASAATITPDAGDDQTNITAQAVNLTLANPTGTALDGWGHSIRIKDNGTPRTIAYGTKYRSLGAGTLPTTTVANKTLYLGMIYNAAAVKWDVVAVCQEA